jgi:hypothetical protein
VAKIGAHRRKNSIGLAHVSLTTILIVSIFWAFTLTVCPELHEWVHPDADHEDHDCAVTLFANGGIYFVPADLAYAGKPSDLPFLAGLICLCSQVLVSAQAELLIPARGPPPDQ